MIEWIWRRIKGRAREMIDGRLVEFYADLRDARPAVDESAAAAFDEGASESGPVRREEEELAARRLLIQRAFDQQRADVATFMIAGMPEWLARAAALEMRADTEEAGTLDRENRLKDWQYFAHRFLRMRREINIPSVDIRSVSPF